MKFFKIFFLLSTLISISGCATRLDATATPGQKLTDPGKVYVQHFAPDKRNLNYIIADKLTQMGYPAMPFSGNNIPDDADVIVTYIDNWQWDITNYMIKIRIDFRKAESKLIILSGESYRTSLARKDPEFMIQETLEKMLQEAAVSYKPISQNL